MRRLVVFLASGLSTAACGPGDDACGPGAAADDLTLTGAGISVGYHALAASPNNDCPAADAPAGVVSLTISGTAVVGGAPFTLCVPRPDRLGETLALGSDVQVIDAGGAAGACALTRSTATAPTGTVTTTGACADGTDAAGFALTITGGALAVDRDCGGAVDTVAVTLAGTAAVAGPSL